VVEEFLLPM